MEAGTPCGLLHIALVWRGVKRVEFVGSSCSRLKFHAADDRSRSMG